MTQVLQANLEAARRIASTDPLRAGEILRRCLPQYPGSAALLGLLGHCERLAGEPEAAELHLRQALQIAPAHADSVANLAHLLRNQGRYRAAAEVMLAGTLASAAGDDAALFAAIEFIRECGQSALAQQLCETPQASASSSPALRYAAAELLLAQGQFVAAAAGLRRTLQLAPLHPGALLRLAQTRRFQAHDDADLVLLQQARLQLVGTGSSAEIAVLFALGKVFDDIGDYAAAAEHFECANTLQRRRHPWDAQALSASLAQRVQRSRPTAKSSVRQGVPIFIVGMPRSGTTLIGNRLGQHPAICNRGELNWLPVLAQDWREQAQNPEFSAALAGMYLSHLIRDDPPTTYYIDKNPLNFCHLDAIAAFFPEARILHCRRAAGDVALSIYSQFFAHPDNGYAYAIDDIAALQRDHRALMADWPQRLKLDVASVDYEAFVDNPERELSRLWNWLGLTAPANRHAASAVPAEALRTASVWQARQPISANSIGRWRNYAGRIEGLAELARMPAA